MQARLEGLAQDFDACSAQSPDWPNVLAVEQPDAWERRVINELARVLHEQSRAEVLVLDAGFPIEILPSFVTPQVFWARVVRDARNGALHGGLGPILVRASKLYPANPVFAQATQPKLRSPEFNDPSDPGDQTDTS